jgi:secernin
MCDTFVALPPETTDGSILFGKNSDREPNEAQALEFYPESTSPQGATVTCTYIEIPQVTETLPVLISRPFWMWGAEIGANSAGVVIGNEAVFTRMPLDREGGLTGMDLLRLALERSSDAPAAIEWITRLLADHGQGGVCGYQDKKMAYHNSFLIADPRCAWVLETAGPLWAAREVKNHYAISNGLTIEEAFDLSHPDLISTAREKGWLKPGQTFNFARCYSDWFYTTFSACRRRQSRSEKLLATHARAIDLKAVFAILRDHEQEPYHPGRHFLGNRICAHAANALARNATQTTGSLVAQLTPDTHTFWATGTAAPCTSVFKPIRIDRQTLPELGPAPGSTFNPANLWWQHEALHRGILPNFETGLSAIREKQQSLEDAWIDQAARTEPDDFFALTRMAFQQATALLPELTDRTRSTRDKNNTGWLYRNYWAKQNLTAKIPF